MAPRNRIAERLDLKSLRGGADAPPPAIGALTELDALPDTPFIEPHTAIAKAVRRAAWLVSQGQSAEAVALLRAAEALERLGWAAG